MSSSSDVDVLKDLVSMPMHDPRKIGKYTYVMRVPGGWVYVFSDRNGLSSCFVPRHLEGVM